MHRGVCMRSLAIGRKICSLRFDQGLGAPDSCRCSRPPASKTSRVAITGTTNRGAEYESPGAFSGWVGLPVGKRLWDAFVERLDDVSPRKTATPIHEPPFRRSLIAAAALNSGAIEGLHGAGRGLTRLVIEHGEFAAIAGAVCFSKILSP